MISGVLEAADEAEAARQLEGMGLSDVEVTRTRARVGRPLGAEDFLFFNEQLASLAHSGLCLDEGLRRLAQDIDSPRLRQTIESVAADLQGGQTLDQALEKHAALLPGRYARVVKAGIASGQLAPTLLNLSNHLRLMSQTRQLVTRTLAYPAVVLAAAVAIFLMVSWLVVPQFKQIFDEWGAELPALTKLFLAFSEAVPTLALAAGVVVLAAAALWLVSGWSAGGRAAREQLVMMVPLLGGLLRDSLRARFLRALAYGVSSGLPLPESIRLGSDATGSPWAARDAEAVARKVEAGAPSQAACVGSRLVPALVGYAVQVGGNQDDTQRALNRLAQTYAARAVQTQTILQTWLTPAAVLVLGLFIALLILALFTPMLQMIDSVSG